MTALLMSTGQGGRHPYAERGHDLYETPEVATRALLKHEIIPTEIWEPACGLGAISEPLREAGHIVFCTDLVDRGYGYGGRDFLLGQKSLWG